MILELDCGNSFIKWRIISAASQVVAAGGVVGGDEELLSAIAPHAAGLRACRLVSVRSDEETAALVVALQRAFAIACSCAEPAESLAGVRNGYTQYEKLGLDRWLALVGAYQLCAGACLILDLGTAVTADFVANDGQHLGGFICPGIPLLRSQLCTHTRRIRYDEQVGQEALLSLAPGCSTAEAVERGCMLMLQGFIDAQLTLAKERLGDFSVFLTGGDSALVRQRVPMARVVPDLVFIGLAAACPLS
jgi:type III pantothenate kinase